MGKIKGPPEVLDDRTDWHRIGCTHRQIDILDDVIEERTRQVEEKGYTRTHDDGHDRSDFAFYAVRRLQAPVAKDDDQPKREQFIEAIAVLLAAVESIDRKAQ